MERRFQAVAQWFSLGITNSGFPPLSRRKRNGKGKTGRSGILTLEDFYGAITMNLNLLYIYFSYLCHFFPCH